MLLFFCIFQYGNQVSAVPLSQFFPFGSANNDAELGDGDDLTASLLFPSPFFFYGNSFNLLGVSNYLARKIKFLLTDSLKSNSITK